MKHKLELAPYNKLFSENPRWLLSHIKNLNTRTSLSKNFDRVPCDILRFRKR
jgi:hypothetical protein